MPFYNVYLKHRGPQTAVKMEGFRGSHVAKTYLDAKHALTPESTETVVCCEKLETSVVKEYTFTPVWGLIGKKYGGQTSEDDVEDVTDDEG